MPTPAEEFAADPVTFMEENVVTVDIDESVGGIYHFTLTAKEGYVANCEDTGAAGGVYKLERNNNLVDTFDAYWLPYNGNRMYHLELRNQAKFMFTPRMDGCTFAVSDISETRRGFSVFSRKKNFTHVSHVNMQDNSGTIDQPLMNFMVRQVHQTSNVKTLKKSDYIDPVESDVMQRETAYKVTTFGVRKSGKWKFYYQLYRDLMGQYKLIGVNQL
jgi:hypothetical protein